MSFKQEYRKKHVSADGAAAMIGDHSRIHVGLALGAVHDLDIALAKRIHELRDLEFFSTLALRRKPFECFSASEGQEDIRFTSTHFGGADRKMAAEGRNWYLPQQFREIPKYWSENRVPMDFYMFRVGPMDEHGNFNIGPQVSDVWALVKSAKKVIVEVNDNMPRAFGKETELHISHVDHIVHGSNTPMMEIPAIEPTEAERSMAGHIMKLIEDGSTLQLGIGGLPNCLGSLLSESDVKNLSCHTEMLSDAYVDLYNAGKITGDKNIDRGKMVYTFCSGTKKLYDFIDNNPVCCCAPVDYVNAVEVICRIDKMIAINGCIHVDLYGQVSSESVGMKQISGTGGQMDYVIGAFISKGGKSFLCTPSTRVNEKGELESRIMPLLPRGSIVTTPRTSAHYIVTEYGAVNLKGKSTWDRSELLISIAHPDFREDLIKASERMGIWRRSSKLV